jgi:hypothetical protein
MNLQPHFYGVEDSSTMKMEAPVSSEMLLLIYITLHRVLEDCNVILTTVGTQSPTYGALSLFLVYTVLGLCIKVH